jgi:hypothetical protein
MRTLQRLDEIANEFRSAILAAEHAGAAQLATEYVEAVRQAWELMPAHERAASGLPIQARELLAWAQNVTLGQRTLTSQQLEIVEIASLYRRSVPVKLHCRAIEVQV